MSRRIKVFDTTLRDGEQSPGCSMNIGEKLEVAHRLEKLKVDVIEAGFAVSSAGDFDSVKAVAQAVKSCSVASLARAVEGDIDAAFEAVRVGVDPRIHIVLATSPIHMEYKLRMSPEEVIARSAAMVKYAKKLCSNVEFSAEDAMRSDPEFLAKVVDAVIKSGAVVVNIPDTVGYSTPNEVFDMITYLRNTVPNSDTIDFAVHCHNDLGLATANTLAGVAAGANQIECTINGLGERAGNAPLEEVVMAIKTRPDLYGAYTTVDTTKIYKASKIVYNIIGHSIPMNKPIVGKNAFSHESGIHQHGMLANRNTYEIITPESVGKKQDTMVLGKHSGRHAFSQRLTELGYELSAQELNVAFDEFKKLCDKKTIVTDSDIEAIAAHRHITATRYGLISFDVHSGNHSTSVAVIRLERDKEVFEEVSLGDGPIDAAYNAIDKITNPPEHKLENYVIHSVSEGKDTLGEVMVRLRFGDETINGRGLSTDIIEASILAYMNAVNKIIE